MTGPSRPRHDRTFVPPAQETHHPALAAAERGADQPRFARRPPTAPRRQRRVPSARSIVAFGDSEHLELHGTIRSRWAPATALNARSLTSLKPARQREQPARRLHLAPLPITARFGHAIDAPLLCLEILIDMGRRPGFGAGETALGMRHRQHRRAQQRRHGMRGRQREGIEPRATIQPGPRRQPRAARRA